MPEVCHKSSRSKNTVDYVTHFSSARERAHVQRRDVYRKTPYSQLMFALDFY
jgi:hypothetical protein